MYELISCIRASWIRIAPWIARARAQESGAASWNVGRVHFNISTISFSDFDHVCACMVPWYLWYGFYMGYLASVRLQCWINVGPNINAWLAYSWSAVHVRTIMDVGNISFHELWLCAPLSLAFSFNMYSRRFVRTFTSVAEGLSPGLDLMQARMMFSMASLFTSSTFAIFTSGRSRTLT